jgi:hypothetical protein
MKTYGTAPPFLTSTLDKGELSASRPCRFSPEEIAPDTHCTVGWVGPVSVSTLRRREKYIPFAGNVTPIPQSSTP